MRILILFMAFLPLLGQAKLLVRDRALFRVERQVFFQEAFVNWLTHWKSFECSRRGLLLLNSLELRTEDFAAAIDILRALEIRSPTQSERELLDRMVRMVKFTLYVQTQEGVDKNTWPAALECVESKQRKSESVQRFKNAEEFLLERFRSDGKRRMDRDDMLRARSFVESVIRSQTHELFL